MNHFRTAFLNELEKVAVKAISTRLTPDSSSVRGFSYDAPSQSMLVTFKNGGTYRYKGVPPNVAKSMGRNKSVGKTLHKRIKQGGYEYEKVGAEGTGFSVDTLSAMGDELGRQVEKHEKPINIGLGAALGGGLGIPVGAMVGGAAQGAKVGKGLAHPNPKAGGLRRLWWAKKHLPEGKHLAQGIRQSLSRGAMVGGAAGLATGGLMGLQIARALKGSREAREMNAATLEALQKKAGDTIGVMSERVQTIPPQDVAQFDTPVSQRVFENITNRAVLPEGHPASIEEQVIDKISHRTRQLAKIAGGAKKQITWNGLTMKIEYLFGDIRSGVNGATGKKWSRKMRDNYGYMPGTYGQGADGEAIDVYFSPDAGENEPKQVFKIRQKKKSGEYDEDKFMVGYASAADAKKAFLRNMPDWAFESMTSMDFGKFVNLVGQGKARAA